MNSGIKSTLQQILKSLERIYFCDSNNIKKMNGIA